MRLNNASIARPAEEAKKAGRPHRCSRLPGHLALIFGVLALAGCGTAPPAPAPVRVEVPVMVPCVVEVPPRPAYEFGKLPLTATDGEIVLALARDWALGRKFETDLQALLYGCL